MPLQHGQTYEWYVVALDAAGNESGDSTSDTWAFTVNLMKAPVNGIGIRTALPARPAFAWASAGIAGASYEVQVASNPADFDTDTDKVCITTSTSCTLPVGQELLTAGTYSWRLLVKVGGVLQTTAAPVRTVVLSTVLPGTPALVSPATNTAFNTEPTLTWKGPTGGTFSYEVQLANDNKFTLNPVSYPVAAGILALPPADLAGDLTDGSTYWWRVRALNADGAPGAWSAARSFLFDTTDPVGDELKPLLSAPANHSVVTGPLPRFTWRAVKGYKRYEIRLSTSAGFTVPSAFIVASTSFTPPGPLLYTSYWWQVRVLDTAGNAGPWSELSEVKVISAANAVPVLNRYETGTPTLSWTPISWADFYEIQVDDSRSFTTPLVYHNDTIPATITSFTLPNPLPNGTYYWRVRAHDPGSTVAPIRAAKWGAWSTGGTGTFQVDN